MKKLLLMLLSVCLMAGCAPKADGEIKLYFAGENGQEIREEVRAVKTEGSLLETAIRALLEGPRETGLTRVIPEDTELLGIKMTGTVAEINLSAPFDTGEDENRLLARYTVIYTACAVPDVQKVKLLVEGKPLMSLRNGEVLGALGAADVSLADPGSGVQQLLTLYFSDANAIYLLPETRQVTLREGQTTAEAIVTEIIRGPAATRLAATVSPDTKVLSAETRAGICFVNVSEAFVKEDTGDAAKETMAVYSIVNSLCALPEIQEVRFLVEGQTIEAFGHFEFSRGFTENKALYQPA